LGDREVDGGRERGELPFALRGGLLAEVGVASAEVDVGGVQQSEHPVGAGLLSRHVRSGWLARSPARPRPIRSGASEAPPGPRSPPRLSPAIVTGRLSRSPADPSWVGFVRESAVSGVQRRFQDIGVWCRPSNNRCAPRQGLHNGTWVAAPDLPDAPAASRLPMWPPRAPRATIAPEERKVS